MKTELNSEEIKSIDKRIYSLIVENPSIDSDEFYVKIWFKYKIGDNEVKPDGRQEFTSKSKSDLINQIKIFMTEDKKGWSIV